MTKQEYKEQSKAISEAISGLRQSQALLDEQYFNELLENDPYKGYEKVFVTIKSKYTNNEYTEVLFITNRRLGSDGTLRYTYHKSRKDGKVSSIKRRFYSYDDEEILSVTPA